MTDHASTALEIVKVIISAVTPLLAALTLLLLRSVHGLVNSAMTEQKRLTWKFAQRVADTSSDPDQRVKDMALADEARKIYESAVR
jgi:hypothetical protein